jgi:hypothetical protein
MNTLFKIVLGAAIAAAITTLMRRQRTAGEEPVAAGAEGQTPNDVSGENAVWGGGGSGMNS